MSVKWAHIHALLVAAALAPAGGEALAQSVSDFRLPPGTASPTPRPQGPVDPEGAPPVGPGTAPAAAAPAAAPVAENPAPAASPRVVVPAPAARGPAATRPPARSAAPAAADPGSRAAAPSSPAPANTAPVAANPAAPIPSVPDMAPATPAPTQNAAEPIRPVPWMWVLTIVLVAIGVGAALLRRKRAGAAPEQATEPPSAGAARLPTPLEPAAQSPSARTRATQSPASSPAAPAAPPPPAAEPLDIELEPLRFSVSLVNAALKYRLRLTNPGEAALGPLTVAADMIGAHASLPEDSQLGRDGTGLELRHEITALAPGESAELEGELRLALAAITPIRSGAATLMIPLVRLRVDGPGIALSRAVVVGETPHVAGGLLKPFRLDTGPRIFAAVSRRNIAQAA